MRERSVKSLACWKIIIISLAVLAILAVTSCSLTNPSKSYDDGIEWTAIEMVFKESGGGAADNLVVGAVSAETGRVFSSITAPDGSVSIRVPQGQSYILTVVSKEGKSFGSVIVQGESRSISRIAASDTDIIGVKAPETTAPLAVGDVVLPNDPTTEPMTATIPDIAIDETLLANVNPATGVPVGIGSYGKTESPSGTLPGGTYAGDPDMDGLPNVIDRDDDGDGILDDWDEDADGDGTDDSGEDLSDETPVEFRVGYLLDIRGGEGIHSYFSGDETNALIRDMRADLMVIINDPARIDAVTSVALYSDSSPSYAVNLTAAEFDTIDPTQYFVDGSSYYPGAGTYSASWNLLENNDGIEYQLSVSENDSEDDRLVCRVGLKLPSGSSDLYEVGDVFTIEIQYDDSSEFETEYYSEMINYIYDNVTRFQGTALKDSESGYPAVDDFTSVWDGTPGSPYPGDEANPIELTYDTTDQDIWFKIIPPQDDDGNYITTGGFRYEIFDVETRLSRYVGIWQEPEDGHCRYDSGDLTLELSFPSEDPLFYAIPIPVQYIIDSDENEDTEVDIEYFMNINEDSYIKNRLRFSIEPTV